MSDSGRGGTQSRYFGVDPRPSTLVLKWEQYKKLSLAELQSYGLSHRFGGLESYPKLLLSKLLDASAVSIVSFPQAFS
jgi:hypothetical protein